MEAQRSVKDCNSALLVPTLDLEILQVADQGQMQLQTVVQYSSSHSPLIPGLKTALRFSQEGLCQDNIMVKCCPRIAVNLKLPDILVQCSIDRDQGFCAFSRTGIQALQRTESEAYKADVLFRHHAVRVDGYYCLRAHAHTHPVSHPHQCAIALNHFKSCIFFRRRTCATRFFDSLFDWSAYNGLLLCESLETETLTSTSPAAPEGRGDNGAEQRREERGASDREGPLGQTLEELGAEDI
ncbi:hypothetical protein L3Q82_001605 [Scortum barcoo]|uniref:Uncharacterized protein n=1 Tax=Scortum barcoo TaxID=214431 RepID=A0ACB8W450_9TELE|nr:hypothetical protein L3Q82_001605 [Scortum barcoo]